MRKCVFIFLILLAGIGVGLSGGVPIPKTTSRKDNEKENIELIEKNDTESDSTQSEIKG